MAAVRGNAAVAQDQDALAHVLRLMQIMRRPDDRGLGPEASHELMEVAARLGVEARRRLVEEEQFGSGDKGRSHVDPPPLPARQRLETLFGSIGEPDAREEVVDLPEVSEAREAMRRRDVAEQIRHPPGTVIMPRLQDDADPRLPRLWCRRRSHPEDLHRAGGGQPDSLEDLDEGALACGRSGRGPQHVPRGRPPIRGRPGPAWAHTAS